jgi:hypothetical protein
VNVTWAGYGRVLYWYNNTQQVLYDRWKTFSYYGFGSTKNDFSMSPFVPYPYERINLGDACPWSNIDTTHYACRQECAPGDVRMRCTNGVWVTMDTLASNEICITDWTSATLNAKIGTQEQCRTTYGFPTHYTCQRLADMFGAWGPYDYTNGPYSYLPCEEFDGYPTYDDTYYRYVWTQQRCGTAGIQPTCQGMADVFGTQDGTWNDTPDEIKSYWTSYCTAANCPTLGTSTGGACISCGTGGCKPFWLTGTVLQGCTKLSSNSTGLPAYMLTSAQQTWYNSNC